MEMLQKFSSSYLGIFARKFFYFHAVIFGLFGLGYIFYSNNHSTGIKDVYNYVLLVSIMSLGMMLLFGIMNSQSRWTFKRFIRLCVLTVIGTVLSLGFTYSWLFFTEDFKDGYFSLTFYLVTMLAFVLYVIVTIVDAILRNQEELKEIKRECSSFFKK